MKSMSKRPTAWKVFAGILVAAACVYVYVGFFFFDPYAVLRYRLLGYVLWGAWLGIPAFLLLMVCLLLAVRKKRVSPFAPIALVISIVVCGVAACLALSWLHYRPSNKGLSQFHPYLQICPQDYVARANTSSEDSIKIFCLGGSTTEYTDSKGLGWPSRVEERLQSKAPDASVECHNLGKAWYTTLHSLINYEVNLRHHKPDVIIVMHAINDLLQNADFSGMSIGTFHEDYRHFPGPLTRLVQRRSAWENMRIASGLVWYHKPRQVIDASDFPGLVSFERNLRTLIDLAQLDGTTVILMTQPSLLKDQMTEEEIAHLGMLHFEAISWDKAWSLSSARRGMDEYNDLTRRIAESEEGVYLIDLEKAIPKTLDYLWDEVHYTDEAFSAVADCIVDQLGALQIIDEPATLRK
jgi:lysophospholipase L1-like esterase